MTANPFLPAWPPPYGLPPFHQIETSHFLPAFERGMAEHLAVIEAIANNHEPATFENTIVALEKSGDLLGRTGRVFWNLAGTVTTPELQAVEREISPRLARHRSAIVMNEKLFARIAAVHEGAERAALEPEQKRVLDLIYKDFLRAGAALTGDGRQRLADITARLAELTTQFGQNVLKDEVGFQLVLEGESDLAGLPQTLIDSAAQAAQERGLAGKHVITLARSHVEPFLQFSTRRDLREKIFTAWTKRGESGGETGNINIIREITALRAERAQLLGYATFADFKLDNTMAKTPAHVRALLDRVWAGGRARAESEKSQLQALARADGLNGPLAAHDWRFYVEKLRQAQFDLDQEQLKPYLALDNLRAAAFDVARRLFGLSFEEVHGLDLYHPDVRAFDVKDAEGEHVALFVADDFARSSKRSGAWMSSFRMLEEPYTRTRPVVINVLNAAKPREGQPALLSLDDARVLFHEFGHALHGMLTRVNFPRIAGTSVEHDFVELPSQLYEHWLTQPQVLRQWARHYQTGEPMPDALIDKIVAMRTFNQGFATVEFCSSAYVDLDLHELPPPAQIDPLQFERDRLAAIGMPDEIVMRHRAPHFAHVFSGDGYAAGYYAYLWSEVL
ncbi:MAG: M3 family metallopeptidase, partial [Alphaproteobacteria bacterium]|nr:M3 family metallopeptidase [Alphaproteobacteria bacterium]